MHAISLVLRDLGLQVTLEVIDADFKLSFLASELLILGFERINIGVRGSTKALLDEFDSVAGLLRLFVKSNEYLGELVNHTSSFEVLSEFLLLLFGCLHAAHILN